jgi:excisionase family DNA binding protein
MPDLPQTKFPPTLAVELSEDHLDSIAERVIERLALRHSTNDDRYMDVKGAADYLILSRQRIYHLTSLGRIPFNKIGSSIRFKKSELDEWVRQGGDIA